MAYILNKKRVGIILITVLLIIVLHHLHVLRPIEHGVLRVSNPVIRLISQTGERIKNIRIYFIQKKKLAQKIEDFENKLQNTQLDVTRCTFLEEENEKLREQLKFEKRTEYNPVLGYVVGKTIDNTANTIIVDKGSTDGIAVDNPVIVEDGILIGKVAKVELKISIVRLINDPQSKIAVTLLNKDRSIGLVEGGFGISVKLTTVLQTELIEIGDLIITSGLEESIPRGLLIGSVASIKKEDYAPFQEGIIEPATNLSRLTVVGIIQ